MKLLKEIEKIFNLYLATYYSLPIENQSWLYKNKFEQSISNQEMFNEFEQEYFDNEEITPNLMTRKYNKEQFEEVLDLFFFGGIRNGGYNSVEKRMLTISDNYANKNYSKKITQLIFNELNIDECIVFHEKYTLDDYEHRAIAINDLDSIGIRLDIEDKSYLMVFDWRWD